MEETSKVLNTTELEEPVKHEVEDKTSLIPVLSEDITEEAVKRLEETPRVLNTPELEEPTKHEVEGTILILVLSEDQGMMGSQPSLEVTLYY